MIALAIGVVAVWLGLAATAFWTCQQNDMREPAPAPALWPGVVAVVPARNEADVIARSLGSLAAQDYPGAFRIILVDDNSEDATGQIARGLASDRLSVISGQPLAPGWTGKLWAVHQGVAAAGAEGTGAPDYLWLTDADIEHAPDTLRRLVSIAEAPRAKGRTPRALVSFMALLSCRGWAEKALIPAFIWFFMMLYPFAAINRRGGLFDRVAGAAGGCVLVARAALAEAGGIAAMRGALIDDCTLGKLIKGRGHAIWLGLTRRSRSIRPYETAGEIGQMIARSAYAQLRYNPALLVGTVLGLGLMFGAPLLLAFGGLAGAVAGVARGLGIAACILVAFLYQPILGFYRRSPLWALGLPLVALFYVGCTVWSAISYYRGRGGMWKGRAQAAV